MTENAFHWAISPASAGGGACITQRKQNGSDIFVIASFRDRRIGYPESVIPAIRHGVDRRASICFGSDTSAALK
jgi:hypothetical protein